MCDLSAEKSATPRDSSRAFILDLARLLNCWLFVIALSRVPLPQIISSFDLLPAGRKHFYLKTPTSVRAVVVSFDLRASFFSFLPPFSLSLSRANLDFLYSRPAIDHVTRTRNSDA